MKVLVTGANGFLGTATIDLFEAAGHTVLAVARNPAEGRIACDLSEPQALITLLENVTPDAVVNCAATVDFSSDCLASLYTVNVLAPALLAQWCVAHDAYLCQVSGTLVHGVHQPLITPSSPIDADTDYGQSKWLAEALIESSGAVASRVRFGGIFGRNGPDHLGLNRAIRAAADGQRPVVVGQGAARRSYIHVVDAARVLLQCVDQQLSGVRWVGGTDVLTISQMMQQLCDIYLPGDSPVFAAGTEAADQVIESSTDLVIRRSFCEALTAEQ